MLKKNVDILLLSWNCIEYLKDCVESIFSVTDKADLKFVSLILVDNGSNEKTKEYIRELEKKKILAKAIFNPTNLGFSKGNNIGINCSKNDVLLLNTDTKIIQPNWLSMMQETAYSKNDIGIVGCRQRNPYGFLMHAGSYMLRQVMKGAQIGWGLPDVNQYNSVREVEGVVGSCMYIKRELINKIGGLPEEFESYYEDSVFCYKAAEAGYKTFNDGRVTIIHHQNTATRENNVSFEQIYNRSRITFIRDWKMKLLNKYDSQIAIRTLAGFPTGYGQASKDIIVSLDRNNVDVRYDYIYGVTKLQGFDDWRLQDVAQKPFLNSIPQITMSQGDALNKNSSKVYRIGFTMLETDLIPKEWVRILNELDEVWVCSHFNKETFENSGVKKPIFVIPLGVDPEIFNPNITHLPKNNNKRFTFLSCFEYGERKAPEILLKAFNDEFGKNDNVQLLLKINNNDKNLDVYKAIASLRLKNSRAPIHMLYNTTFYEDTMGSFYRLGDCYVSSSRGEGFGLPLLEAMACGVPVISTAWSGVMEFLNKENSYLVNYQLVPAIARCPYYEGFKWAEINYEELRKTMRYVYEHPKEAKERAVKASAYVIENFNWDKIAAKIKNRINELGFERKEI